MFKNSGSCFYGIYKIIFYCILPYGIMATLPTQMLIGVLSLKGILFGMIIVCIFTFFSTVVLEIRGTQIRKCKLLSSICLSMKGV